MHSIYYTRIEYSSETCCHSCFSRFLPPGCTATSLSAPLSWYFPPHLTPPLSSLMTVNKADRLIYLHWWQGRKKSSAKPCPAPGLWQAGLGGNPGRLATPRAGHISLCCPWPCSDLTARWDQSFLRPTDSQTHSHISYRGESERRRESSRQSGRLLLVVCTLAERKTGKPVFVLFWFFFFCCATFPLDLLMSQAGSALGLVSVWGSEVGVKVSLLLECAWLFCNFWTLELYCKHYDSSGLWTLHTNTKQV